MGVCCAQVPRNQNNGETAEKDLHVEASNLASENERSTNPKASACLTEQEEEFRQRALEIKSTNETTNVF